MRRKAIETICLSVALGGLILPLTSCDVDVVDKGKMPEVKVEGGRLPEIDVDAPKVTVGTKEVEVEVPKIKTETETIKVPVIGIEAPKDDAAESPTPTNEKAQ